MDGFTKKNVVVDPPMAESFRRGVGNQTVASFRRLDDKPGAVYLMFCSSASQGFCEPCINVPRSESRHHLDDR